MNERKFLFGFLMFSILVLIILLGILFYREYDSKQYNLSKQVTSEETNIENKFVQSIDNKEDEKEAKIATKQVNKESEQKEIKLEMQDVYNELENKTTQNIEQFEVSYDAIIVNSEQYSRNFVNSLIKQLSYIPSKILENFYNQGWTICIVTEEEIYTKLSPNQAQMYSMDEGNFIKGYTSIGDKTIYITYDSITLRDNSIIHEVGHYYDISNGWPSSTQEYQEIYIKEKDRLNSKGTYINTNRELFAETFEYVILEEEGYQDLETYKYVKKNIYQ